MDEETHIDLGVSHKEQFGSMPMEISTDSKDDKQYPRFYYSGPVELDLPQSGEMEIQFVKRSETSSVRDGGKHWYECAIEVRCICKVESDEEEAAEGEEGPGTDAEKALDTIARALGKDREETY